MIAIVVITIIGIFSPILGFPVYFIEACGRKKWSGFATFMLAFAFAIIGFNLRAIGSGMDLIRHIETANTLSRFDSVWDYVTFRGFENNFLYPYYLRFATFLGNRMLPFVSTFISMLLLFSIFRQECKKHFTGFIANFTALLYMCLAQNFLIFASGIRQVMAFLIFIHLYQIESQKKASFIKRILCFAGYFLLCFYHNSITMIIVLRLLSFIAEKNVLLVGVLLAIWTSFWDVIQNTLGLIDTTFTDGILDQMDIYKDYNTTAPLMYLIWTFQVFLFGFVLVYIWRNMPEYIQNNKNYYSFCVCALFFAIGCYNQYTPFNRMNMFCWLLTCKLLPVVVQDMINKGKTLYVGAINGSTLLACAYYFVSAYVDSDSNIYWYSIKDFLTTNIFTIITRSLLGG